jgi:hypothetical protein
MVGMLRTLLKLSSSSRSSTTSTFLLEAMVASSVLTTFVDGASPETSESTTCRRPARTRSERAPSRAAAIIFFGVRWA